MKQRAIHIPAEPLFTNDEWFARVHLFDDGIRQMEAFLASLPDDRIRREFWLFVHAVFDVVVDYSKASNNYPKKNELFRKLSGNQALKYYQPLFDWFTSEVNIKRTSFDQLLEVYWKDVFKLNY